MIETTKTCTSCKKEKNICSFPRYGRLCKQCISIHTTEKRRTRIGLCRAIYYSQKRNSKKREHKPPDYTEKEFIIQMMSIEVFEDLYTNWVASKYNKKLSPSADRLDDSKGYSFDNLRLVTWKENNEKETKSKRKPVAMYSINGEYIQSFKSLKAAACFLSKPQAQTNISEVCKGKQITAYNYKWQYK